MKSRKKVRETTKGRKPACQDSLVYGAMIAHAVALRMLDSTLCTGAGTAHGPCIVFES